MKRQWYEELFDNYARNYDKEPFTMGTPGEVDFIEKEINYQKDFRILDIGCRTGRHTIELAKRGYRVTGLDLSESQLTLARKKAAAENVAVTFEKADARQQHFTEEFDLVIIICEGGFSLMETDEMNFNILKNARKALKPDGKLILTCLNALFPLFHPVKDFLNRNDQKIKELTFDLMTFRDTSVIEFEDDSGDLKILDCNERYFAPSEITWYLKSLDFISVDIFGCKPGNFSRNNKLSTEDFEMLVVAEKKDSRLIKKR
ncbi:MAG: class I SAM-dependent methyltransferase [Bacteroidales bacterium]|nr:MAG: class I SAM-dependent methyltransferase [Bacteroidales bacterium]